MPYLQIDQGVGLSSYGIAMTQEQKAGQTVMARIGYSLGAVTALLVFIVHRSDVRVLEGTIIQGPWTLFRSEARLSLFSHLGSP